MRKLWPWGEGSEGRRSWGYVEGYVTTRNGPLTWVAEVFRTSARTGRALFDRIPPICLLIGRSDVGLSSRWPSVGRTLRRNCGALPSPESVSKAPETGNTRQQGGFEMSIHGRTRQQREKLRLEGVLEQRLADMISVSTRSCEMSGENGWPNREYLCMHGYGHFPRE